MAIRLIPAITTITAIALTASGYSPEQSYRTFHDSYIGSALCDTAVMLCGPSDIDLSKAIEIRGSSSYGRKADPSVAYGIAWGMTESGSRYQATLQADRKSDAGDFIDNPAVILTIAKIDADGCPGTVLIRKSIDKNIDTERCVNTIAAEIDCRTGHVDIFAGNNLIHKISELDIKPAEASGGIGIVSNGCPGFEIIVTEHTPDRIRNLHSDWTLTSMKDYFNRNKNNDPQEGFWHYLDRDNDPRYCRPGGIYTLAFISDNMGGYDIIYVDGAETAASQWETGMYKGHLEPTRFKGHFNVRWIDAIFNEISGECSATFDGDAIVRFDFPLLKTAIRFAKRPTDM